MYHSLRLSCHTITTDVQINDTAESDIDDTEESLVLFLELLLVEYLNCKDAFLGRFPVVRVSLSRALRVTATANAQVKALIPVRIQRLFDDTRRFGLLAIDGRDGEGVRKACRKRVQRRFPRAEIS